MAIDGGEFTGGYYATEADEKAWSFFVRADLVDVVHKIWDSIKWLQIATVLKVMKVVTIMVVVVAFANNVSLALLIAAITGAGGAIVGMILTAFGAPLVSLLYAAIFLVDQMAFCKHVILAVLMIGFFGFSPGLALVLTPVLLLGCKMLKKSPIAKQTLEEFFRSLATAHRATLGAIKKTLQQVDFAAIERIAKRHGLHSIEKELNHLDFKSIGDALRNINLTKFEKAINQVLAGVNLPMPNSFPSLPAVPTLPTVNLPKPDLPKPNSFPSLPAIPTLPTGNMPKPGFAAKLPTRPKINFSPTLRLKPKKPKRR